MAGHRTFLKLGELPDGTIEGMFKGGYELEHCSYSFNQGVDEKGEAQTEVYGGVITLIIKQLPSDELIKWGLDSRKYASGAIILYDPDNIPVEKTFFKNAACISMKIKYETDGNAYLYTTLTIQAQSIIIGEAKFENKWVTE